MKLEAKFVSQEHRFSLDVDAESGRAFVSIPVRNRLVEYCEWYEVDQETFRGYLDEPMTALEFVEKARRREIDHLLLYPPGSDRGEPD